MSMPVAAHGSAAGSVVEIAVRSPRDLVGHQFAHRHRSAWHAFSLGASVIGRVIPVIRLGLSA